MLTSPIPFSRRDWMLIILGMLGVAVSVIPVAIFALGAFIKPLSHAFGWGRGGISATFTFLAVAMAVGMPVAGTVIDRYGSKGPGVISLLLYAAGMAAVPTLLQSFGLDGLYVASCWIGATGSVSSSIVYTKIVSRRFDSHRGLALGIVTSGVAVGAAVTPMLAVFLIGRFDWQAGFYGLAALPVVIGVPIMLTIGESRNLSDAPSVTENLGVETFECDGKSFRDIVFGSTFMILLAVFLISAMAINGIQLHLLPIFSDKGFPPNVAAQYYAYLALVSIVARLLSGYLVDRFFAPYVGALCYLLATIGIVLLSLRSLPISTVIFGASLLWVAGGAESDLLAILASRYFGMKIFGRVYGWLYAAFMVGSAVGPFILGTMFDRNGSYQSALVACAIALGLTVLLLIVLPNFPGKKKLSFREKMTRA